jgi:hypothetical protein
VAVEGEALQCVESIQRIFDRLFQCPLRAGFSLDRFRPDFRQDRQSPLLPHRSAPIWRKTACGFLHSIHFPDHLDEPFGQRAFRREERLVEVPAGMRPAANRKQPVLHTFFLKQPIIARTAVGDQISERGAGKQLLNHGTCPGGGVEVDHRGFGFRIPAFLITADRPEIPQITFALSRCLHTHRGFVRMGGVPRLDVIEQGLPHWVQIARQMGDATANSLSAQVHVGILQSALHPEGRNMLEELLDGRFRCEGRIDDAPFHDVIL